MKRLFFMTLMVALSWHVSGQRPLITAREPGYMFVPSPDRAHIVFEPRVYYDGPTKCEFSGNAYRPGHPVTVYGVAMALYNLETFPYLWVYMFRDSIVDSATFCYTIEDTVRAELFCFIEQEPVPCADIRFVATERSPGYTDTAVFPFYEFYFDEPVEVPAGQRFFVGISQSSWNVYNHWYKGGNPYAPHAWLKGPHFVLTQADGFGDPWVTGCEGDGLDSTWYVWKAIYPGLVDWTCGRCYTPPPGEVGGAGLMGFKYSARAYYPIIRPPSSNTWVHPPHLNPLLPGRVRGLRMTELDGSHASFAWDTLPRSDWGAVGVNVYRYQVNYAPYMEEYDENDMLLTTDGTCTLSMDFDSTVMYKVRCRVLSHHVCDIHDTTVCGEWSQEVYFHTGVGVPDTMALECRRVEGLRYDGLVGGNPKFSWGRSALQSFFEVQYAAVGGSWQRAPSTNSTTCVVYSNWVPGTRYMVRVRAKCNHQCQIHDTVMVSEWSDTIEFTFDGVGVDEAGEAEGCGLFALAPNPASGSVTVRPAARVDDYPAVLTVSDANGREVLRRTLADGSPLTIDVGALTKGAYLVTLTTHSRQTGTQRLVVE